MLTMEITRLIERCRKGDADALGELYKAYAKKMKGVCSRYVSNKEAIDDVLHDAFVIIFTSFDRLRDDSKAEAWMMSITRNVASKCKDHLRKKTLVPLEEAEDLGKEETEQENVKGVPTEEVLQMIERLPLGYSQVFRLSVFEGKTHNEIADMLGIEPHSSSSQLARAKKMLRKMMQQYWAAILLLLFVPITFLLFRKEDTAVTIKEKPSELRPQTSDLRPQTSDFRPQTLDLNRIVVADTLQSVIAQTVESIKSDTLSNTIPPVGNLSDLSLQSHDTTTTDDLHIDHSVARSNNSQRSMVNDQWSLELAYAGQINEQHSYNQPYSFKPVPSDVQSLPSQSPTIPSSIDNWMDYAVYLANNPNVVSEKTRSVIMRIAQNNANQPGEDKIVRTSHHQMPVTWSLALKYKMNSRFGLESGLSYSRLASDFEMGTGGNTINEHQTIHYLGIPVKGICNIYGGKLWGLYGSLGLMTEMPVHSTLRSDYYLYGQYETSDKTTLSAPWQFSTTFGLGLQYQLTPNVGFFAEPSLQYFIPMNSDIETYRTEHPFNFTLPLGIRFTW